MNHVTHAILSQIRLESSMFVIIGVSSVFIVGTGPVAHLVPSYPLVRLLVTYNITCQVSRKISTGSTPTYILSQLGLPQLLPFIPLLDTVSLLSPCGF